MAFGKKEFNKLYEKVSTILETVEPEDPFERDVANHLRLLFTKVKKCSPGKDYELMLKINNCKKRAYRSCCSIYFDLCSKETLVKLRFNPDFKIHLQRIDNCIFTFSQKNP